MTYPPSGNKQGRRIPSSTMKLTVNLLVLRRQNLETFSMFGINPEEFISVLKPLIMYERCRHDPFPSLGFVWLNSKVLFTWEINLRPNEGYYPPTLEQTLTYRHAYASGRTCTWTNTNRSIMFAGMENKQNEYACAWNTCLHILIGKWQTGPPSSHKGDVCIPHALFSPHV